MFTAYYLLKDGHSVIVLDTNPNGITSIYNSGILAPSAAVLPPIAMKSILMRYLGRKGPVYVSPIEILKNPGWFRMAVKRGMHGSEEIILALTLESISLYKKFFAEELVEIDIIDKCIGVYEDLEDAKKAASALSCTLLNESEIYALGIKDVAAGVWFERDISLNPAKLFLELRRRIQGMGGEFVFPKQTRLQKENEKILFVGTENQRFSADIFVVSAGAWCNDICKPIGYDSRVLPARGLVMIFDTKGFKVVGASMFLEDYGTTVGQHNENTLRMTSFFELVGFNENFSQSKKKWVYDIATSHLVHKDKISLNAMQEGVGFRPCAPDQLPVIGKMPNVQNLYIATGNCRLGVTLAPVTGDIIKSMINGEARLEKIVDQLSPARFR